MGLIENNINSRIESWKKSLLDMTKRNRLLWYKPYRIGSLKLEEKYFDDYIESVLKEVDKLASNGKTWEFITETDQVEVIEDSNKDEEEVADEALEIIKERTKALSNIYKKVKQESEEKGLNIGYIAVGFLEWYEREDAQVKIKTPLILVPIKIEQDGRRAPFRISLNTDEQISLNPIIKKKFETDFDITLNDFSSDSDTNSMLSTYLSELRREISEESNWTIKDDIIIDTFSFQNLAIWNDLDKNRDLVTDNPFSRILAGGSLVDEGFSYESGEPDLEKVKSKDSKAECPGFSEASLSSEKEEFSLRPSPVWNREDSANTPKQIPRAKEKSLGTSRKSALSIMRESLPDDPPNGFPDDTGGPSAIHIPKSSGIFYSINLSNSFLHFPTLLLSLL